MVSAQAMKNLSSVTNTWNNHKISRALIDSKFLIQNKRFPEIIVTIITSQPGPAVVAAAICMCALACHRLLQVNSDRHADNHGYEKALRPLMVEPMPNRW
jgi:hypothetical protein